MIFFENDQKNVPVKLNAPYTGSQEDFYMDFGQICFGDKVPRGHIRKSWNGGDFFRPNLHFDSHELRGD